jgi:hypothetical protein
VLLGEAMSPGEREAADRWTTGGRQHQLPAQGSELRRRRHLTRANRPSPSRWSRPPTQRSRHAGPVLASVIRPLAHRARPVTRRRAVRPPFGR